MYQITSSLDWYGEDVNEGNTYKEISGWMMVYDKRMCELVEPAVALLKEPKT